MSTGERQRLSLQLYYVGSFQAMLLCPFRIISFSPELKANTRSPSSGGQLHLPLPTLPRLCWFPLSILDCKLFALVFTLKLWLRLPGAGGKPTKDVAIRVLQNQDAGALVDDVPAQLCEAFSMNPRAKKQPPFVLQLSRQVGVDVHDRWEVEKAEETTAFNTLTCREQVEGVMGFIGKGMQDKQPLLENHFEESRDLGNPEHPIRHTAFITGSV